MSESAAIAASSPAPDLAAETERLGTGLCAATAAIGVTALAGWALDAPALRSVVGESSALEANAAAALVLLSASCLLRCGGRTRAAALVGGAVAAVAALTLVQFAGVSMGRLDQVLFLEPHPAPGEAPGRMSPLTAAALLMLGAAEATGGRVRVALAAAVGLVGFIALTGYAYRLPALYGAAFATPISLMSGLGVTTGALAILAATAREGAAPLLLSATAAGVLVRRLLPIAVLLPLALDLAVGALHAVDVVPEGAVAPLQVALRVVALVATVLWTAASLDRADRERAASAEREGQRRHRLLVENVTAGLAVYRLHRREGRAVFSLEDANPAFERLAGAPLAALRGRPELERLPGLAVDDPLWMTTCLRALETGVAERLEHCPTSDGRWLAVLAYRIDDNELATLVEDVTDRRHHEEEVELLTGSLADRANELRAANQELEAFAYSVSHDLRAPLRSISGFSEAILEDCGPQLDAVGKAHLGRVIAEARRMGELIDDLLELSRIIRAELHLEEVDLTALAREVVDDLRRSEPARSVEVLVQDGLRARGDASLLRLVLQNLLGNAWKFTSRHATARIEVGRRAGEDGNPEFFVADDGAGFDMAYADHLFAPFRRLHDHDEFPGTGIGLASVRRIVRRLGGEVRATGAIERGATFTFTLPA